MGVQEDHRTHNICTTIRSAWCLFKRETLVPLM